MINNFSVDWKEAIILFLALVIIILLYYFANRKSIAKQEEIKRLAIQKMRESNIQDINTEIASTSRKSSPQILQSYERLIILLERIDIQKISKRIAPISNLKQDYAHFLIQNIEQEFDFNVSQQLYVSDEAWALILTAKNTIIQKILQAALKEEIQTAQELQSKLISTDSKETVTDIAKTRLRKEVSLLA